MPSGLTPGQEIAVACSWAKYAHPHIQSSLLCWLDNVPMRRENAKRRRRGHRRQKLPLLRSAFASLMPCACLVCLPHCSCFCGVFLRRELDATALALIRGVNASGSPMVLPPTSSSSSSSGAVADTERVLGGIRTLEALVQVSAQLPPPKENHKDVAHELYVWVYERRERVGCESGVPCDPSIDFDTNSRMAIGWLWAAFSCTSHGLLLVLC